MIDVFVWLFGLFNMCTMCAFGSSSYTWWPLVGIQCLLFAQPHLVALCWDPVSSEWEHFNNHQGALGSLLRMAFVFDSPVDETTDVSKGIQCHMCPKKYRLFGSLVQHYKVCHLIDTDLMKGHYIYQKKKEEDSNYKSKKATFEISEQELEHVALAFQDNGDVDEKKFVCLKCSDGREPLTKRECEKHMAKYHGVDPEVAKEWACAKDGIAIRNNPNTKKLLLTAALEANQDVHPPQGSGAEAEQEGEGGEGGEDEEDQGGAYEEEDEAADHEKGPTTWEGLRKNLGANFGEGDEEDDDEPEEVDLGMAERQTRVRAGKWAGQGEAGESAKATYWVEMPTLVQVDKAGNVLQPLSATLELPRGGSLWTKPVAEEDEDEWWADLDELAEEEEQTQCEWEKQGFAKPTPKAQPKPAAPSVANTSPEALVAFHGSSTDLAPAPAPESNLADSESSFGLGHMVRQMHVLLQSMNDPDKKSRWLKDLPEVKVKDSYLNYTGPPAKGDQVEGKKTKRANWPKDIPDFDLVEPKDLPDFEFYLNKTVKKKDDYCKTILGYVGRALGALEIKGVEHTTLQDLGDVKTLVAFYISREYIKFFDMDLMNPKYAWAIKTIDSLTIYCQHHLRELSQKMIRGEAGPWENYTNVLNIFMKDLRGAYRQRCEDVRNENISKKMAEDLETIKNLPEVKVLQVGVKQAYMTLRWLAMIWGGMESMPVSARALANSCLVGAILLDTFMGRSYEWEVASYQHLCEQLEQGVDWILCRKHKTSGTYGDLAKFLSPGLVEALKAYMSLPRPDKSGNFLLPASGSGKLCMHSSIRTFANRFLPQDKAKPTVNLIRKLYHTTLMKLSDTKEKLQELMVLIDAHSKAVQKKHYCLRDPEDHVKLAKQLVKTVIGETVPWPTEEDTKAFFEKKDELTTWLEDIIDGQGENLDEEPVEGQEKDTEHYNDDLPWWELAGELFGIPKQGLTPLADCEPPQPPATDQLAPLVDAEKSDEPEGVKRALGNDGEKVKHEKTDKGSKREKDGKEAEQKKHEKEDKHKKRDKEAKPNKDSKEPVDDEKSDEPEGVKRALGNDGEKVKHEKTDKGSKREKDGKEAEQKKHEKEDKPKKRDREAKPNKDNKEPKDKKKDDEQPAQRDGSGAKRQKTAPAPTEAALVLVAAKQPPAEAQPPTDYRQIMKKRRDVSKDLEIFVLTENLKAEGGATQARGTSFFKGLRERAIALGLMNKDGPGPEGLRTVVRDYFKALQSGAPPLAMSAPSSSSGSAGQAQVVVKAEKEEDDKPATFQTTLTLSDSEKQWAWAEHKDFLYKQGFPKHELQKMSFFKALRLKGVMAKVLNEEVTPEMLLLFVRDELGNQKVQQAAANSDDID